MVRILSACLRVRNTQKLLPNFSFLEKHFVLHEEKTKCLQWVIANLAPFNDSRRLFKQLLYSQQEVIGMHEKIFITA